MDMDDDEFVETSDIEELAELQRVRTLAAKSPRRAASYEVEEDLPRKRIKLKHPPTEMFMRLSVSPQKTPSSHARSRSSSITLEHSSPSSLFTLSRSPTVESPEVVLSKTVAETHEGVLLDEDDMSQDPLLLCTPPGRIEQSKIYSSTTPPGLPAQQWLMSPAITAKSLPSVPTANEDVDDVTMLFTPVKTPAKLPSISLSPIFSESPIHRNVYSQADSPPVDISPANTSSATLSPPRLSPAVPSRESSRSPPPTPSVPAPRAQAQAAENRDHALAMALEQDNARQRPYSLRERRPAQLRPYSAEHIAYIHTLRSNPDAIVEKSALGRHRHDSGHYQEETQQDVYREHDGDGNDLAEGDEEWMRQEKRRLRREEKRRDTGEVETRNRLLGSQQQRIMDKLPAPPGDSDDEGQEEWAREAAKFKKRKMEEERKRKREEKEEKERKRRLKRFPALPNDITATSVSLPTPVRRSKSREPEFTERSESPGIFYGDMDDLFSDVSVPPPVHIPPSLLNQFHDTNQTSSSTAVDHDANPDMDWDADASQFDSHQMDIADVPEEQRQSDGYLEDEQVADADIDQALEEAIDLPKLKLKYLRRVWPTSMIKQNAQMGLSAARRKKEQKRRERLQQDYPGELAPGQSRVKKSTHTKSVDEIKGDSESDVEIVSDHHNSPPPFPAPQFQNDILIPPEQESEDEVEVLESYRRPFVSRRHPQQEIRQDDSPSEEDTVDEDDLEDYILAPQANGIDHLRDPSLIDYMLTRERPRNITSTRLNRTRRSAPTSAAHRPSAHRRPSTSPTDIAAVPRQYSTPTPSQSMSSQHSSAVLVHRDEAEASSSSNYRFDVTTTGGRRLGHSKQTLLDFHVATKPKPKSHIVKALPSRPNQAASHRSHNKRRPSRHSSNYLFTDNHDDSDPSLASAQTYDARRKKQPSSRPRITTKREAGPSRPRHPQSASSSNRHATSSGHTADADNQEPQPNTHKEAEKEARRLERARKKRVRKKREKQIGVWCDQKRGQVVTSGVVQTFVTVDEEDEGFHVSLFPPTASKEQAEHWSTRFRPSPPPPPRIRRQRRAVSDTGSEADIDDPPRQDALARAEESLRHLPNDMGIPLLQPGKKFDDSSYINKGWLHELVKVVSGTMEPVRSGVLNTLDVSLEPDMTVDQFCAAFSYIAEEAFSFATDLPLVMVDEELGMDENEKDDVSQKQWLLMTQAACRMVSLYVRNAQEIEVDKLRESIEKDILQLMKKVDEFHFKSISPPVLIVAWFMVEVLARAGKPLSDQYDFKKMPQPLKTAVTLLMRFLLNVEMGETVDSLTDNVGLSVKTTDGFAAELWVRLIHLLHGSTSDGSVVQSKHLFWSLLIEALKMRSSRLPPGSKNSRPFEASEDVWGTIFTMCALSQFSLHGVVAGQPRLPACWDIVVHALSLIRLDSHKDPKVDEDDRKRHDEYVALLVNRCMALRQKWHWSLRDSNSLFSTLATIFRSRQFANLLHETKVQLPDFMRWQKLHLVSSYSPEDTTYAVFLKLVIQAAQEDPAHTREKPSPRVKKFVSLALPVSSVTTYDDTSKDNRKKCRSMFYNRLAAVAVAVDLDIHSYDERFIKAQNYVPDIGTSHSKLQFDVIGGLTSWAQFLVSRTIKLDGLTQWLGAIASDLSKRKQSQGTDLQAMKETRTNLALSAALLSSVRRIYTSHVELGIYPDPLLIQGLQPILNTWLVKHEEMSDHVKCFLEKLFEARFAMFGNPQQLGTGVAENQDEDSQDYWGNVADIPLEAFVDPVDPLKHAEESMHLLLDKSFIRHAISQHLGRSLKLPPADAHQKSYEKEYDAWIRLALSYYILDFEMKRWKDGIRTVYSVIKINTAEIDNESWIQRIHLSALYHILLLHPMSYEDMIEDSVRLLMLALVSAGEALENAYVAKFLSVGGLQHPLLQNATFLPPMTACGSYEFSPADFAVIRLSLFKLILHNLNNMDTVNRQDYSTMCANAFSSMKQSLKIHRKRNGYEQFCRDVKAALDGNAQLANDPKFDHWTKLWVP